MALINLMPTTTKSYISFVTTITKARAILAYDTWLTASHWFGFISSVERKGGGLFESGVGLLLFWLYPAIRTYCMLLV